MRILSLAAAVLLTTTLAACTDMDLEGDTMTVVKTSASGPPAETPAPVPPEQRRKASSVIPPWGVPSDPEPRENDGLDNLRPGQKVWLTRAQAGGPAQDYRFRFVGSENGPTTLFLVVGRGATEKEYFVDRCSRFDTDEFFPEGLLTPVECDGRRIVLEEENGSFIVRGGRRTLRVPATGRG